MSTRIGQLLRIRERRNECKRQGICVKCKSRPANAGIILCQICREKEQARKTIMGEN